MKEKIAIFNFSMTGGGAERFLTYLLPYLHNHGHSVVLVLMNETMAYQLPDFVKIHYLDRSPNRESGIFKLLKLPWLAYKYSRFLKKDGITHSLSLLTRPCYVNIMARWFTKHPYKLMISERNYPSLQYSGNHLQARINRFLVKWLYPKADLVVSNAKASAQDLVDNFNVAKEKTDTIYNPIDIEKIKAIPKKEDFFDPNYLNAVSIGRLVTEKNHTFLLDAIAPFEKIRLYIFGDGELREELESKLKRLNLEDRVFLMGFERNPFPFLKAADFFLFGSLNEGFPNVLLEAMCCNLPIVSTNCKSGPDEMLELEKERLDDIMITKYGILTPVEDVQLMQKALAHIMDNPRFLSDCRPNLAERISDYEPQKILEAYRQLILS